MKYVAYRIDTTAYMGDQLMIGYYVRGQRETDYNWPIIAECASEEECKECIKRIRGCVHVPVYGPDGYEITVE